MYCSLEGCEVSHNFGWLPIYLPHLAKTAPNTYRAFVEVFVFKHSLLPLGQIVTICDEGEDVLDGALYMHADRMLKHELFVPPRAG